MGKFLLFIDALSGNLDRVQFDPRLAQQLIAQRLALPFEVVERLWTAIDLSWVQEMDNREPAARPGQEMPSVAGELESLIAEAAGRLQLTPGQLECVVVVPAIGHDAVLRQVVQEVGRLTVRSLVPVIVLWREESGGLQLFHVIPEPDEGKDFARDFARALEHTKAWNQRR